MQSITFLDETATGKILQSWDIEIEAETMTVQEIIMLRVEEEIRRRETEQAQAFFTQQELSGVETILNTLQKRKKADEPLDPEAHGYRALEAFQRNAYFVLIGNKQAERLDEVVQLHRENPISFVRLTPLVGG